MRKQDRALSGRAYLPSLIRMGGAYNDCLVSIRRCALLPLPPPNLCPSPPPTPSPAAQDNGTHAVGAPLAAARTYSGVPGTWNSVSASAPLQLTAGQPILLDLTHCNGPSSGIAQVGAYGALHAPLHHSGSSAHTPTLRPHLNSL